MSEIKPTRRDRLVASCIELVRRQGYAATTVDSICQHADVTKGAFFHHFATKEDLIHSCLDQWDAMGAAVDAAAPYQGITDPAERVQAYITFYLSVYGDPLMLKSCLAGTVTQHDGAIPPTIRERANACLVNAQDRFAALLQDAFAAADKPDRSASMAALWMATLQGSLVLCKASNDDAVITENIEHFREYLRSCF